MKRVRPTKRQAREALDQEKIRRQNIANSQPGKPIVKPTEGRMPMKRRTIGLIAVVAVVAGARWGLPLFTDGVYAAAPGDKASKCDDVRTTGCNSNSDWLPTSRAPGEYPEQSPERAELPATMATGILAVGRTVDMTVCLNFTVRYTNEDGQQVEIISPVVSNPADNNLKQGLVPMIVTPSGDTAVEVRVAPEVPDNLTWVAPNGTDPGRMAEGDDGCTGQRVTVIQAGPYSDPAPGLQIAGSPYYSGQDWGNQDNPVHRPG